MTLYRGHQLTVKRDRSVVYAGQVIGRVSGEPRDWRYYPSESVYALSEQEQFDDNRLVQSLLRDRDLNHSKLDAAECLAHLAIAVGLVEPKTRPVQ